MGGEGVAIVYKDTFEAARLSAVASPGLEAVRMSFGARGGFGVVLPGIQCNPWQS